VTVGERGRVLVVDDETLIREGIKHYLNWEQEGFEIVGEASNGQEALQLIETTQPHIIITDIVMPVMDGEELTRIVKERYPQIEIIILSSFGEFDYVRSTFQCGVVDYILKPKLDAQGLLKTLKTAAARIPSLDLVDKNTEVTLSIGQIIQKLVAGYPVEYAEKYKEAFHYRKFCLLGCSLKNGDTELPVDVINKIKSEFTKDHYAFHYDQNMILVNGDDFSRFIQFVNRLAHSSGEYGFVLSETFTDFFQVGSIYKDSLVKLLNFRFYLSEIPLLMEGNLPKLEPIQVNFNLDWFASEFKRKNFEGAFCYLQEHALALSKCYTLNVYEYKAFFGNVIFNITVLLGNMGYKVKELEQSKYDYFKLIDEAKKAKDVLDLLNQFITLAKQCIYTSPNQINDHNLRRLLEYIDIHYAEPLNLTDVAKHFHFNPSYLSSYFSTHKGEGFIEYLNRVRIEEASKLLVQGGATISEISGMVGYSDHSYFCKVFKKIKGVSPSQYRRKQNMR